MVAVLYFVFIAQETELEIRQRKRWMDGCDEGGDRGTMGGEKMEG